MRARKLALVSSIENLMAIGVGEAAAAAAAADDDCAVVVVDDDSLIVFSVSCFALAVVGDDGVALLDII